MPNHIFYLTILLLTIVGVISCTHSNVKQIDRDYLYAPPFEKGNRFLISQAFNGSKTHTGILNRYAVDIVMPIGTQVCAARSGIILEQEDSNNSPKEAIERSTHKVNYVKIKHSDNTIGMYAHLKRASITVKKGQKVAEGDCFAQSGNSGYSTGPHLHFSILKKYGKKEQSVPFVFSHPEKKSIVPQYLAWLYN